GRKHYVYPGYYLLGKISPATVYPSTWGAAGMAGDQLIVRSASARLTKTCAIRAKLLRPEQKSIKPLFWESLMTPGTRSPEDRWEETICEYTARALEPACTSQDRRKRNATEVDYSMGQAWMSQPQRPRPHWRQRTEIQNDQALAENTLGTPITLASTSMTEPAQLDEPWDKCWARIQKHHIDRRHRHIAWQVLHGTLSCGALDAYRKVVNSTQHQEAVVSAVQGAKCAFCEDHLHTISHMLVHCQVAARVWSWAATLWALATANPAPLILPSLILVDDRRGWEVSKEAAELWTDIRVIVLAGLFTTSEQRRKGLPVTTFTVAAYVVHHIRGYIIRDWQRTVQSADSSNVSARLAQDICCTSWLRGRSPRMDLTAFIKKWGKTSAFC
ncbi:hypothetical protein SLEP1_g60513, partial [Rubroshorea leprosula]